MPPPSFTMRSHHLKIYSGLMELSFQLFMPHVWHEAYWRMTVSGGSVFRKLLIWQVVINCATFLSPFFAIALHLILWLFGWNSERTFVMIFTTDFTPEALLTILLKTKSLIMASTSLIRFFVLDIKLCKTGQPCLFLRWIGI